MKTAHWLVTCFLLVTFVLFQAECSDNLPPNSKVYKFYLRFQNPCKQQYDNKAEEKPKLSAKLPEPLTLLPEASEQLTEPSAKLPNPTSNRPEQQTDLPETQSKLPGPTVELPQPTSILPELQQKLSEKQAKLQKPEILDKRLGSRPLKKYKKPNHSTLSKSQEESSESKYSSSVKPNLSESELLHPNLTNSVLKERIKEFIKLKQHHRKENLIQLKELEKNWRRQKIEHLKHLKQLRRLKLLQILQRKQQQLIEEIKKNPDFDLTNAVTDKLHYSSEHKLNSIEHSPESSDHLTYPNKISPYTKKPSSNSRAPWLYTKQPLSYPKDQLSYTKKPLPNPSEPMSNDKELGSNERDLGSNERDLGSNERDLGSNERGLGSNERELGSNEPLINTEKSLPYSSDNLPNSKGPPSIDSVTTIKNSDFENFPKTETFTDINQLKTTESGETERENETPKT